ncbi:hypothetical protein EST38_g1345 [Candolleomyces aberdarensis]|uniref:Uncharacterized protein n=1 Tax=Candolleomyces aberdarensis TaxID=2316362 RepID=A0A4Q2DW10_9AGAR|nr:hypothetical protein EST38_g1345 [Candolleomyces aberdarensis]
MITPKPPPSGNLPPRPDEAEFTSNKKHHRRSSSSGRNQLLDTIPEPSKHPYVTSSTSPFPPPAGPLPPTPLGGGDSNQHDRTPPVSRHSSLKNRLRILSAPSPSSGPSPLPQTRPNASDSTTPTATPQLTQLTPSVPSTPNAEKMMTFPNDFQSFLQMNTTPTPANIAPSRILDYSSEGLELVEVLDEVTPLAPPPRRGSLVKPLALLPVETRATVSVDTIHSAGTFHFVDSARTGGSDKMVISRSSSMSTQDEHYDQYSPIERQEGEDDDDDSGSLRAKVTPTMPTMTAPDPIHAFSLSPPSSVVSLGLVSS